MTDLTAGTALNTFPIPYFFYVHHTVMDALITMCTFTFIDLNSEYSDFGKQCVYGAKGTYKAAEAAIDEHGTDKNYQH